MTLQDLATAVELKLPFKIFILNNLFLGMVRQWQELFHDNRFSATPLADCPDFVKLADAYGCLGLRATTRRGARQGHRPGARQQRRARPSWTSGCGAQEKVFPMVPAGAPLNDMIDGE